MTRRELQDKLRQDAQNTGFGAAIDLLLTEARECIYLFGSLEETSGSRSLGASFIGSDPDLPEGTAWPNGIDKEGRVSGQAHFFAQFNLADIPSIQDFSLPATGMLWLFARRWHFLEEEFLAIRDADSKSLERAPSPGRADETIMDLRRSRATVLRYAVGYSLPFHRRTFRDALIKHGNREGDEWEDFLDAMEPADHVGQIGGYSHETELDLPRLIAFEKLGKKDLFHEVGEYESIADIGTLASTLRPKVEWVEQHRAEINEVASNWRLFCRFTRSVKGLKWDLGDAMALDIFIHATDLTQQKYDRLIGEWPMTL